MKIVEINNFKFKFLVYQLYFISYALVQMRILAIAAANIEFSLIFINMQ